MVEPKEEKNANLKETNAVPGREFGRVIFPDHMNLGSSSTAKTTKVATCANLHGTENTKAASLLEEWQKWLLHSVNVNVCGNSILGVLTNVHPDYITVIGESHVFVIPTQHVAFICYEIK